MKILIVEDEKRMADALSELLQQENYLVDICYDGTSGSDAVMSNIHDVIVLDVMLPGKDGFSIIREARSQGIKTPVLMLTAKDELEDKITGLDGGADDYLTKPFMVKELLARVRALHRRNIQTADGSLTAGDIHLNPGTMLLSCMSTDQEIRLSEKEFHILEHLIMNKGQIVTREQLTLKVWGYENNAEYNNVEVYISFTRKKLSFIGSKVQIRAVRGVGYELRI